MKKILAIINLILILTVLVSCTEVAFVEMDGDWPSYKSTEELLQKADYVFEKLLAGITDFTTVRKLLLVKLSVQKPMLKEEHNIVYQKLHYVFSRKFENAKNNFALVSNGMESNSYMKILSKGFAFAESLNAQPVTSVKDAEKYKTFDLVFSDGRVRVRKEAVQEEFIFD